MAELDALQKAQEFLHQKTLYQLGALPTEACHPLTAHLSELAQSDLAQAYQILHRVDLEALQLRLKESSGRRALRAAINETLSAGRKIFLCGCGATGRLSLSLEYLWRQKHPQSEQVIAFMAGGDVALVHSLEGFEDFPEYGARHLEQLGFQDGDLLISTTEGGETPYVIGATLAAAKISKNQPFFLYCNPRDVLIERVERSRRVLQDRQIRSASLYVGPMALAGSTRMQASTVLMLEVGLALLGDQDHAQAENALADWVQDYSRLPLSKAHIFTRAEAEVYRHQQHTIYSSQSAAMTVFTDTTERAPTFSLVPFDNRHIERTNHSLTYVMIPLAASGAESWRQLLNREPRVLNWPEINSKTTLDYLSGFDFSRTVQEYRQQLIPHQPHYVFSVEIKSGVLSWKFQDLEWQLHLFGLESLLHHLSLKMLLNMHSTLIMGILGRYWGNMMTYVYPTNGKLIDRATRYVRQILTTKYARQVEYDEAVMQLFRSAENLAANESVVLKTVEALK